MDLLEMSEYNRKVGKAALNAYSLIEDRNSPVHRAAKNLLLLWQHEKNDDAHREKGLKIVDAALEAEGDARNREILTELRGMVAWTFDARFMPPFSEHLWDHYFERNAK